MKTKLFDQHEMHTVEVERRRGNSYASQLHFNCKDHEKCAAYQAICSAEENADDTMIEQHKPIRHADGSHTDEWHEMYIGSLRSVLSERENEKARTWFAKRGFTV